MLINVQHLIASTRRPCTLALTASSIIARKFPKLSRGSCLRRVAGADLGRSRRMQRDAGDRQGGRQGYCRDREYLYRRSRAEHPLRVHVFLGGDLEQRRASGGENEPSYPRLRASPCRIRSQVEATGGRTEETSVSICMT